MYYCFRSPPMMVLLGVCCVMTSFITAGSWLSGKDDSLDEINDGKILKAVQSSMREWEQGSHRNRRVKRSVKKVCYGELGCFEDSGHFSYLEMLPTPPEEINTKFYFYSTKNRSEGPLLELPFLNMSSVFERFEQNSSNRNSDDVTEKAFVALENMKGFSELSTRVIVHGFGSACPHVWIYEMKTALMAVENCIVICVDWENGASLPNYVKAAANTRLVGKQLAMLLINLQKHKGLNLLKTHIIGFSLGAHVAGFAGAKLPGLSRITGLDPAGPLFESQHPKVRLDTTDANFVDVIHSNGENLILGGLGSWQPMGHVDFYPNGGRVQNGCSNLFLGAVTDFIFAQAPDVEGRSLCNHRRAYKFFIDSVAPRCIFPAFPCDSYEHFLQGKCFPCKKNDYTSGQNAHCGNMGYYADKSTGRGQLYLLTREEEPFCAHQFQLEIYNSFNDLPLRTIGKLEATLGGEGGLNETFLISEKEDTEFFAGQVISKIVVPHPALGFPTSLTLQYSSYKGWLSKGLSHWDIDKVVITDSFGRRHSLCQPSLSLSSGFPVYMTLQSGLCELPQQVDTTTLNTESYPDELITQQNQYGLNEDDDVESTKHKKDILNLGANIKIEGNKSYDSESFHHDVPWQPILEGNSLEREGAASSRSLHTVRSEVFEPVLKNRKNIVKGRNINDFDNTEIMEPILKSTTPQVRKVKEIPSKELTEENNKAKEAKNVTVQLFPFRLGELLERAEIYARETLLPLISEQAPRIFGFGTEPKGPERKPRYIPRYEEELYNETTEGNNTKRKPNEEVTTQTYRNIFDLTRDPIRKGIEDEQTPASGINYYSNKVGDTWNHSMTWPQFKIDLPTFRPETSTEKQNTSVEFNKSK